MSPFTSRVRRAGLLITSAAALALAVASPASAAPPANGGFETPLTANASFSQYCAASNPSGITGWTVSNACVDVTRNAYAPRSGLQSVDLSGNAGDAGAIFQDFDTLLGATYTIGFWAGANPSGGNATTLPCSGTGRQGSLAITGNPTTNFTGAAAGSSANFSFREVNFVATSTTTRMTFAETSPSPNGCGIALDDVTVTLAADVPLADPRIAAMGAGIGAAGLALVALRRRQRATA